ncbi:hypothetical protein [Robbsia andropogonis]|uniref:hypothetical protein n=1 Tax=Robbsia andropogonis TaxID=28092 RepID=UPI002A6A764A|nr:hypothetical protein [Robbsia andropogonis]
MHALETQTRRSEVQDGRYLTFRQLAGVIGCREFDLRGVLVPSYIRREGTAWLPLPQYRDSRLIVVGEGVGVSGLLFTPEGVEYFTDLYQQGEEGHQAYIQNCRELMASESA